MKIWKFEIWNFKQKEWDKIMAPILEFLGVILWSLCQWWKRSRIGTIHGRKYEISTKRNVVAQSFDGLKHQQYAVGVGYLSNSSNSKEHVFYLSIVLFSLERSWRKDCQVVKKKWNKIKTKRLIVNNNTFQQCF